VPAARSAAPRLGRSREDYLKALYALGSGAPVPVTVLARALGVSAPSVTNMLARLAGERLVALAHRGAARLTGEGEREALRVVRRHRILEAFLVRVLSLDWSEAHEDAEVLEHHVSDRVLDALDRHLAHPSEDPHGHPIPDAQGRLPRRALLPLSALRGGARARVREIRDRDRRRMERWKRAGLVPGASVRMTRANVEDDVFELEVEGRRLVLGHEALEGVLVERPRRETRG
jgi:DtxR family Mn-dependent transcriptional regulator